MPRYKKQGHGYGRRHRGRHFKPYGHRNYTRHFHRTDGAFDWRRPISPRQESNQESQNEDLITQALTASHDAGPLDTPPPLLKRSDSDMDYSITTIANKTQTENAPITPSTQASSNASNNSPFSTAHTFLGIPINTVERQSSADDLDLFGSPSPVASIPSSDTPRNSPVQIPEWALPFFDEILNECDWYNRDASLPSPELIIPESHSATLPCPNNPNVIGIDCNFPVAELGESMYNMTLEDLTNRGVKTCLVRSFNAVTDQANNDRYYAIGEALKFEALFIDSNQDVATLLREATDSRKMNDTFRANTGIPEMISGLESIVRNDDDIKGAVQFATLHLRNKIGRYLKQPELTIELPNGQHYGERGSMLNAIEIIAMANHIKKDPARFIQGETLDIPRKRGLASRFLIPRFHCIGTNIVNKFFQVRFGTKSNPKVDKVPVPKGFHISLHD